MVVVGNVESLRFMMTFRWHHSIILDMQCATVDLLALRVERSAIKSVKHEKVSSMLAMMIISTVGSCDPRIVISALLSVSG